MLKRFVLITLTFALILSMLPLYRAMGQTTTLKVEPEGTYGLNPGDTFSVNITVTNVIDLYAWQFKMYYQSTVINGTSISEGPFLKTGGMNTFYLVTTFTDNYNATHGFMWVSASRVGSVDGQNGSGVLATIEFKTVGGGNSILYFDKDPEDTKLLDSSTPFRQPIPHTAIDGWAYVGEVNVSLNSLETPTNIGKGAVAYINVTSQNKGQFKASFDVTLYYDLNPVETKTVIDLPAGAVEIFNFTWDTAPVPIGGYTIKATATPIPGEVDLSDNNLSTTAYVGTRDLATTNVNPYKTSIAVGYVPTVDVQVLSQNNGQATETFNVSLYAGPNLVGTQTTALISGGNGMITFTWNTSTLSYGNHTLIGSTGPLPYETQVSDNNFTRFVIVTVPGDTNGDFNADIYDAILLAGAYNSNPADPNWNANADINNDNTVDIYDAIILSVHYGEHYP